MDNLPLVTIGAINYNNAKYLIETLESIKAQTYSNLELVIVDDCSTDNSVELINEWLQDYDKPHKLVIHEKNYGVCKTCNSTLKNAHGKYYNLIATDDIMLPDKIKFQVEILEKSVADVCAVYSDAYLIKEDSSPRYGLYIQMYRHLQELPNGDIYQILLEGNFLPAMAPLIKMEHLNKVGLFDESLAFEDYDMWLRLAKDYKFVYSDYISVKYRMRRDSLVVTIKNWNPTSIKIYLKHIAHSQIALIQILKIARDSYRWNDKESLQLLEAANIESKFLRCLLMMDKLPINRWIGLKILERLFNQTPKFKNFIK
ncbi:glycosyltransferase family 2 protein [Adhaeribacter aquaticus]|uniref:glycosyltransferase family 2 protein n=1 Tax=Adhaeribacter aquaticus TaxID=299567 RepID=UPI0004195498|nr:glycosyltransferase [Adhaeribacter aquaticus]